MNYLDAIARADAARKDLYTILAKLEGLERKEALRVCLDSGMSATELAEGLGISRQRIYQIAK